jgi:hypothetical protein
LVSNKGRIIELDLYAGLLGKLSLTRQSLLADELKIADAGLLDMPVSPPGSKFTLRSAAPKPSVFNVFTVFPIVPNVPATEPAIDLAPLTKSFKSNGIFGYPYYTYLLTLLSAEFIIYIEESQL